MSFFFVERILIFWVYSFNKLRVIHAHNTMQHILYSYISTQFNSTLIRDIAQVENVIGAGWRLSLT